MTTLQSGLSFDASTGRISGTPTEGGTVAVSVTVQDDTGSATVGPKTLKVKQEPAPTVVVAPAVTGTAKVGQTLLCSDGTWSSVPSTFYRYWDRRLAGTNDSWIGQGVFTAQFVLRGQDVGYEFRCRVSALKGNSLPSIAVASNVVGPVVA